MSEPVGCFDSDGIEVFETDVLIIGGGVTGTGVMRDLALRGIHCLLIDGRDLNGGASGGNHGLLHSGGRYASADADTAAECRREGEILKCMAPECIDECGGLFVAVEGDDTDFADRFSSHCGHAGIDCETLTTQEARELEPTLSERVFAAYRVPDATIDPFRLTLENVNHARDLTQSQFLPHTTVTEFEIRDGVISATLCRNLRTNMMRRIHARQVVNAGGAWAMVISQLAGCFDVSLLYSKGTLMVSNSRIAHGVVNRLRIPGDGDILVPGGTVSVLGTTSDAVTDLDLVHPTVAEVERNLSQAEVMIPCLASTRFIRAYAGVRPLLKPSGSKDSDGRQASRGFTLFDHEDQGLGNFATVTGGKLTTYRLMAEKTGDLVARRLGNDVACATTTTPLPSGEGVRWTEPGYAPRAWFKRNDPSDRILCECEMVPQSAIDEIVSSAPGAESHMTLQAIGVRSRVGKGSCQGAFCSLRVTSYMYDCGLYEGDEGAVHIREFLDRRFHGLRPVAWGGQVAQLELAEAVHCGLMGLDHMSSKSAIKNEEADE